MRIVEYLKSNKFFFFQLNKSIAQRKKNIELYEKTIGEAEARYGELVNTSSFLVKTLKDATEFLDQNTGNKKVGPNKCGLTYEEKEIIKKYIEEKIIEPAENIVNLIIFASTQI